MWVALTPTKDDATMCGPPVFEVDISFVPLLVTFLTIPLLYDGLPCKVPNHEGPTTK